MSRTRFPELGVVVSDGTVSWAASFSRKSQPLAGAEAVVTDGGKVHRLGAATAVGAMSLGVGTVLALSRKSKASAIIAFVDGTVYERKLSGNREVRNAQAEAVRFNALARAAGR